MTLFTIPQQSPVIGLNTQVVNTVRSYGPIPKEVIARITDRRIHEIEDALCRLVADGVVKESEEGYSINTDVNTNP